MSTVYGPFIEWVVVPPTRRKERQDALSELVELVFIAVASLCTTLATPFYVWFSTIYSSIMVLVAAVAQAFVVLPLALAAHVALMPRKEKEKVL